MEINFKFNLNGRLPIRFLSFYSWYLGFEKSNGSKILVKEGFVEIVTKLILHLLGKSSKIFIKLYLWLLRDILKKEIKYWRGVKTKPDGVEISLDYKDSKPIKVLLRLLNDKKLRFGNFELLRYFLYYLIFSIILFVIFVLIVPEILDSQYAVGLVMGALMVVFVASLFFIFIFYQLRFLVLFIFGLFSKK